MSYLKNKIIYSAIFCAVLFGGVVKGQSVEFGIRYMPAFTKFDINTSAGGKINGDIKMSNGFGVTLGYNFSDHVGIQTELIYSSYAQQYKESDIERNINLKYVNIPLLLALNTNKSGPFNFGVVFGPQIGLSAGSKLENSNSNNTNIPLPVLKVKSGDLGFAYGAGFDFGLNPEHTIRLGLGFRGVYGLIDISDNSATVAENSYYILDKTKIKVYSGYLGISFLF